MSVLIKGIGIPKSCSECRFCVNGFTDDAPMYECACETYENVSVLVDDHGKPFDFRPDWCPLTYRDLHSILAEQPTIIEAEMEDVSSRTRQLARQAGKILVDAALNAIKESERSDT